jgi:alanine racemase
MAHSPLNRIEIDLGALRGNYLELQQRVGNGIEVMAMVKADAYGHGLLPAARALAEVGARTFGVAEVEEGIILRQGGLEGEIVLLLGASGESFSEVLEYRLSPVIFDLAALEELSRSAERAGIRAGVHLKVDVGMGRVGIMPAELPLFLERMAILPGVRLAGVSGHLPMADRPHDPRTGLHCHDFASIIGNLRTEWGSLSGELAPPRIHFANSAAMLFMPHTHFDMVRPGIALYGYHPGGEITGTGPVLKPVMSFKSRVLQLKEVPAGYGLSYGHTFVTERASRLAILPVGYDDGYLRRLSNRAVVLIRGQRVPLRGTICMNACVADVTELPEVQVGDEVVLLGRQGRERISAHEIAGWLETIHYEVLCLFGSRNARSYEPVNR